MKSVFMATAVSASYNESQARIALQLSQDAYCGKDKYMKHVYEGYATGF